MYTYIEVLSYENSAVTYRIDVTGKGSRQIGKIEDGLNLNLNHEMYFTKLSQYNEEQPKGNI